MQKEIDLPRERSLLERTADIAAGWVLVGSILALGIFGMACAVQLAEVERQLAAEARV